MNEVDCHKCNNCFDNGETIHFDYCNKVGGCVDCDPNQCKGEYYEKK